VPDRTLLTPADADRLAARFGVRVVVHGAVGSTMDEAARDRGRRPALHVAARQTAGRGRRGRRWSSPAGNLYATLAWADPANCFPPATLAAIQLAWAEAVAAEGGPLTRCKWPNDGLVGGAKWAGAIAERSPGPEGIELRLGLGANLVVRPPGVDPTDAAALGDHWPGWPGAEVVAEILLAAAIGLVRAGPGAIERTLERWPGHDLFEPGAAIRVTTEDGDLEGRYGGLDPAGRLRLETPDGWVVLASGEARRLRRAGAGGAG